MRFYFDGQVEGRKIRTPVQLGRWAEEPLDAGIHAMYERLLSATSGPLFHDGEWKLIEASSAGDGSFSDLIAFRWRAAEELAVVVANLGSRVASADVPIVDELPTGETFDVVDRLTGASFQWTRTSMAVRGLFVRLEPGHASIFVVRSVGM
jgi:hypothetical protein